MIDTKSLEEGDICLVSLEDEDGIRADNILCIFINGQFQNIEKTYTYVIYGSSVYQFKKIQTATNLHMILSDKVRLQKTNQTAEKEK